MFVVALLRSVLFWFGAIWLVVGSFFVGIGIAGSGEAALIQAVLGGIFAAIGGFVLALGIRRARTEAMTDPTPLFVIWPGALRRSLRTMRGFAEMFGIVLAAILIAELFPPVKSAELYIEQRQSLLLTIVAGVGVAGFVLMMGGILHMAIVAGDAADSFSLQGMKQAWRSGAYRNQTRWRRRYITAIGACLLTIGLFGFFIVIGPAWLKVLMGSALGYAIARTVPAIWKA